jgi:hypothetical protein
MKKQFFNLIEIALAIAIIAVGMSSVLVLFPAGLNAVNSASADSCAPDAVQYLAGYVESRIRNEWNNSGAPGTTRTSSTISNLPTSKPGAAESWNSTPITNTPIYTSSTNGLFKYEQTHMVDGEAVTDFAAAARVWKTDTNHIAVPGQANPVEMTTGSVTIFIEVSYPLEKPYDERETQIYRLDLYDYGA